MQQRLRRNCWQSCPSSRQGLCQRRSGYTYSSLLDASKVFRSVHLWLFYVIIFNPSKHPSSDSSGAQKETACLQILDAPTLPPITKSTPQLPEFQVQLLIIGYYLIYFLYKISVTQVSNIMFKPLFNRWTQIYKWVFWKQEFHLYTAERAHQNPKNNLLLLSTSADSNDSVSFLLYIATIFVIQFLVLRVPWNTFRPCTDAFVIVGWCPEGEAEFCPRWDNRLTNRTTATSSSYLTTL